MKSSQRTLFGQREDGSAVLITETDVDRNLFLDHAGNPFKLAFDPEGKLMLYLDDGALLEKELDEKDFPAKIAEAYKAHAYDPDLGDLDVPEGAISVQEVLDKVSDLAGLFVLKDDQVHEVDSFDPDTRSWSKKTDKSFRVKDCSYFFSDGKPIRYTVVTKHLVEGDELSWDEVPPKMLSTMLSYLGDDSYSFHLPTCEETELNELIEAKKLFFYDGKGAYLVSEFNVVFWSEFGPSSGTCFDLISDKVRMFSSIAFKKDGEDDYVLIQEECDENDLPTELAEVRDKNNSMEDTGHQLRNLFRDIEGDNSESDDFKPDDLVLEELPKVPITMLENAGELCPPRQQGQEPKDEDYFYRFVFRGKSVPVTNLFEGQFARGEATSKVCWRIEDDMPLMLEIVEDREDGVALFTPTVVEVESIPEVVAIDLGLLPEPAAEKSGEDLTQELASISRVELAPGEYKTVDGGLIVCPGNDLWILVDGDHLPPEDRKVDGCKPARDHKGDLWVFDPEKIENGFYGEAALSPFVQNQAPPRDSRWSQVAVLVAALILGLCGLVVKFGGEIQQLRSAATTPLPSPQATTTPEAQSPVEEPGPDDGSAEEEDTPPGPTSSPTQNPPTPTPRPDDTTPPPPSDQKITETEAEFVLSGDERVIVEGGHRVIKIKIKIDEDIPLSTLPCWRIEWKENLEENEIKVNRVVRLQDTQGEHYDYLRFHIYLHPSLREEWRDGNLQYHVRYTH